MTGQEWMMAIGSLVSFASMFITPSKGKPTPSPLLFVIGVGLFGIGLFSL